MRKAVFSLSRSWIGTCQYPLLRSRVENQRGPLECFEEVVDARNGMCVFHGRLVELPEVHTEQQAAILFLHHDDQRVPGAVGGTDDAAGQHLLDLSHLFSSNSRVLAAIRLAERRSFGLYGVLQERRAAQIVLSLAHNVAEFLEVGLQLLLLGGRQVCGDRRQATRAGGGCWRRSVSDNDDF